MAEKTRRELLAEAFDKSVNEENEDDDVVVGEPSEDLGEGEGSAGAPESDGGEPDGSQNDVKIKWSGEKEQKDGGSKKPIKEIGKKPSQTEEERQEAEAARQDAEGKEQRQPVTDKAPNSWKPALREHWAKIPAEARAEITRREREIQTTLSQTANIRKFAGDFASVVNPFAHLIRAQNSTPLQAVHNLMSTAAGLMVGNDDQKAAIVADIIQNYGVDCEVLDKVLSALAQKNGGRVPNRRQAQPQEQIPTWARPLIESNQRLTQMQEQHNEQMRQQADDEIAKVEQEPFFEDLREDVADIMEIAANRGRKMTVKQAYEKAVELNPEIKKLVAQTKLRQGAGQRSQAMSRARRAASTVAGSPMGKAAGAGPGKGEKLTRKQQLAQAWEDATDR